MKVGDYVRVKAGVPKWLGPSDSDPTLPPAWVLGKRLRVIKIPPYYLRRYSGLTAVATEDGDTDVGIQHLEPWRDDEIWVDGKWVKVMRYVARDLPARVATPILYGTLAVTWGVS